jgi:hypothetical protein
MGRHSRRNNRAEETVDPVVRALKFVAQNSDFDRAWRPADDYGRIIDLVFDVPRGMKDELTSVLINSHLSTDPCISPFVDFDKPGSNVSGIFRKEYQHKTPDGKNCKSKYIYLCSENEFPVKPEGKWYHDIKALPTGWDKGPRGMGENENENYKKIRIDLLILLRELRKKGERPKKKAMDKRERDKEPSTGEPSAKKSRRMSEKKESSRIAHLLRQVLESSTKDDAKEAVSRGDVCSLLRLAFRIHQKLDSLTNDYAKEADSQRHARSLLVQFLALEQMNQNEEIEELDEDEDEDYSPESEMEDDDEIEDELEYDPESDHEGVGYYDTRVLFLGNKEFDVPKSHEFISCSRRSRLEKDQRLAAMLKAKVRLSISRNGETRRPKQYRSSPVGRRYYAAALFQAPYLSLYAAEQIFPLVVTGFLADAGIIFHSEAIAASCPAVKTLDNMFVDGSVDSLLWLQDQLKDALAVFIACDKGNRKGIAHFPKVISWWSKREHQVMTVCIDADGSGGTSQECAQAIFQSLRKLNGTIPFFFGQTTDSGGGGVLYSLKAQLEKLGLVNPNLYFVAPCTLHAMNLIFANSVKSAFGEGGLEFRNIMQLLHSLYDLVGRYEKGELGLMWADVNGEPPPNKISAAVLTRWWWVNVAAQHLKDNWEAWKKLAQAALNATTASTAAGKIASSILSLMEEGKIKCDLFFMVAFSKVYFVKHMKWLQRVDDRAKGHGYISRHMPVRTYLITSELNRLSNDWETNTAFEEFVALAKDFTGGREVDPESDAFEMTDDGKFRSQAKDWSYQDIKNQVNHFFEVAQDVATKHFEKEWTGPLLHFAVAGEKDTSVPFCNWLVNNETMGLETIDSECHDTTIDLSKMLTYFATKMSVEQVKEQGALSTLWGSVEKVAAGANIWESEETADLREYSESKILPLASSTHRVEAMVRECSHCAATNRGEASRSHYIFQRSVLNTKMNDISAQDRIGRVLRANGSTGPGVQGEREIRSEEAKRKHGGGQRRKKKFDKGREVLGE